MNTLRRILLVSVGLLVGGAAVNCYGGLIALWSFDGSSGTTIDTTPQSGSGSLTLTKESSEIIQAGTGTTLNDPRPSPTVTADTQFMNNHGNSHTYTILIQITGTASLQDYMVTYAAKVKNVNTVSQTWAWSTTSASSGFTSISGPSGTLGTSFSV